MLSTIWKSTKLLEIYLKEKNTSILLWNYKGYRLRKSWITFRTLDNDIEILINYIKKNFPNYKFIVFVLNFLSLFASIEPTHFPIIFSVLYNNPLEELRIDFKCKKFEDAEIIHMKDLRITVSDPVLKKDGFFSFSYYQYTMFDSGIFSSLSV